MLLTSDLHSCIPCDDVTFLPVVINLFFFLLFLFHSLFSISSLLFSLFLFHSFYSISSLPFPFFIFIFSLPFSLFLFPSLFSFPSLPVRSSFLSFFPIFACPSLLYYRFPFLSGGWERRREGKKVRTRRKEKRKGEEKKIEKTKGEKGDEERKSANDDKNN